MRPAPASDHNATEPHGRVQPRPIYLQHISDWVARMRRYTLPAALLLTFGLLAGCGQKGPLYLPQPQPAVATPAPAASAAKPTSVAPAPAVTTHGG